MSFGERGLSKFHECPKCRAPLERLLVGGVGSWKNAILCEVCQHIQQGIAPEVIASLVADQYGISRDEATRADRASQEEYVRVVGGGSLQRDMPTMPRAARWHARRADYAD